MADPLYDKKYDILDNIVEAIHNECIRIEKQEKDLLVRRFQMVIDCFVQNMRDIDSAFDQLYNRIGYTGSFYDGLRISEATEFDLNIILKVKLNMETTKRMCPAGFINIKVINANNEKKPIKNWIDKRVINEYLNPRKFRGWFEGIVTKTLNATSGVIDDCELKCIKSGPAMTLRVKSKTLPTKEICIDLVPVIEFPGSQWPPIPEKSKKILNGSYKHSWVAVPKGDDWWRMSFPCQEQCIIRDFKFLKYTLRLMKKVRDELGFHGIASYYIKTLFMWEVERKDDAQFIWSKTRRGRLFMHMLIRFRDALENKEIPFYWDNTCNLIGQLNNDYLDNCYHRLQNFIKKIDRLVDAQNAQELNLYIRRVLHIDGREALVVGGSSEQHCYEQLPDDNQYSRCTLL